MIVRKGKVCYKCFKTCFSEFDEKLPFFRPTMLFERQLLENRSQLIRKVIISLAFHNNYFIIFDLLIYKNKIIKNQKVYTTYPCTPS